MTFAPRLARVQSVNESDRGAGPACRREPQFMMLLYGEAVLKVATTALGAAMQGIDQLMTLRLSSVKRWMVC
jgi:hypothetical protein